MSQSQIAARVGVSERHYHRVKDYAISTLRDILLEMEAVCEKEEEE
jgi:DNA-directed RNA polymerase specialized sigma subunit